MSFGSRIKTLRQRDGQYFENVFPIGADGKYIDMESGLDLEQELKLGNNHYVEIQENEDTTIIRQYYLDIPKGDTALSDLTEHIKYSVETTIDANDNITSLLYRGNISEDESDIIHSKVIKFTSSSTYTTINEGLDIEQEGQ